MNKGIVVGSYRNSPWLSGCLNSIPSSYPVIVVRNDGYECGAIKWTYDHTNLDEFLFLQDSTEILDSSWLDDLFDFNGTVSLNQEPCFLGSYLGKWRREILSKVSIPVTVSKSDAVIYESVFTNEYLQLEPNRKVLWPELGSGGVEPQVIHGRQIKVMENEYFRKYKSCWSTGMIPDVERIDKQTSGRP